MIGANAWWRVTWWVSQTWHCRIRRRHHWQESMGGSYCDRCGLLKTIT